MEEALKYTVMLSSCEWAGGVGDWHIQPTEKLPEAAI
jgi:hypothetical protein